MNGAEALIYGLAQRGERVAALQAALTACRALGPENGGPGELEKACRIAAWLSACGVTDQRRLDARDTRVPSGLRPNLVARIPGRAARTLWLFGHMDVVPPGDAAAWRSDPWQLRREGDALYGRGVEDNQQALVCMLLLAEELHTQGLEPALTLGLVFMADEETGSAYGLRHVLDAAPELFSPGDIYLVPDAGSPAGDAIEIAEKANLWLRVAVTGVQCHASTPHKGRNAMVAASAAVLALAEGLPGAFPAANPLFDPPGSTFVPSKREANVPNVNTVPGADVFYVDCRLVPGVDADRVLAEARRLAAGAAAAHGAEAAVTVVQRQEASAVPADCPDVAALRQAVAAVYGVDARPVGIGGATVAACLRERGLPALVWSRIENTCHQPNEHASIASALGDAQVFARLLMQADGHA